MKRSATITVVIAAVIVVAVAAFAASRPKGQNSSTSGGATNSPQAQASTSASDQASGTVMSYGDSGFSPASVTVKSGGTVTFKNTSSEEIQVDSNPHPVHTDDTDLNVGPIAPGQSKTVTLSKTGTFGIHNHLDPSEMGHVTIQ
jgi:plastocyanin